jgi:hypothetical protein
MSGHLLRQGARCGSGSGENVKVSIQLLGVVVLVRRPVKLKSIGEPLSGGTHVVMASTLLRTLQQLSSRGFLFLAPIRWKQLDYSKLCSIVQT